jgi:phthalate 4,5-dioxygenase oxygenase subunit
MLTKLQNDYVTRTGPGTPMGELFRRFWTPALLASEISRADGPPVRVRLLGEDLIAFRDSHGRVGLLDAYCPHRRANLFWGRNEADGLRCIYHGWKFDVSGQCVDLPNCPEGEALAPRVRTRAYPTEEHAGIVWAYLGPHDQQPEFPHMEMMGLASDQLCVTKIELRGNYLQGMEGDIDSSHVSFLHSRLDGQKLTDSRVDPNVYRDRSPRWFPERTNYGMRLAAQRDADDTRFHWRVNQYLMPYCTLIPAQAGKPIGANIRVPIDDEHSLLFRCFGHPERKLNDDERAAYARGVIVPEMVPGTFRMVENEDNDYNIDREMQRTETFAGIKSIVAQDLAVVALQGGKAIFDRSEEYLVSSDRAIIMLRKLLIESAEALEAGEAPKQATDASAYSVRACDFFLPRDVGVAEGARELLRVGVPV